MSKVIGIVGSRRRDSRDDYSVVYNKFCELFSEGDRIVSGGCPIGADKFAEQIAKANGITISIHYPNWNKFGNGAGIRRNTFIVEDCDVLIACVSKDRTGGTEDSIRKAQAAGKPVHIV